MDSVVSGAITALGLNDPADVRQWLEVLHEVGNEQVSESESDWTTFLDALRGRAAASGIPSETVESFAEYVNTCGASLMEVIGELAGLDDEPLGVAEQSVAPSSVPGTDPFDYDVSAWTAFLAENGPRWNGDESAWDMFVAWFSYQANEHGLAVPANQFLGYAQNEHDKVAFFAQYEITIGVPAQDDPNEQAAISEELDVSSFPDVAEGDSGDWVRYLDTMLAREGF